MVRFFRVGAMVALLLGGLSIPAQAVPVALNTEGISIQVGDKLFNNFTCSVLGQSSGSGFPNSCADITVDGATSNGLNGLTFQLGANIIDPGTFRDILIGYDATVVGTSQLITDIHLAFNGSFSGTGTTRVTETARTIPGGVTVGQAVVTNPPEVLDHTIFLSTPQSSIRVTKDIFLAVNEPGPGTANISFVDQFLSQTAPEPGSLALLGTALFGWGMALRRRSKART